MLKEAVLIIFTLSGGEHKEMLTDPEMCLLAHAAFFENALMVEDVDLPRQRVVGVECKCAVLEDDQE